MRRTPCDCDGRVGWIPQAELLKLQKSGQFPDDPAKIEDSQIHSVDSQGRISNSRHKGHSVPGDSRTQVVCPHDEGLKFKTDGRRDRGEGMRTI